MKARDFRAQARAALKGKWWITTLLVLLAIILGAGSLNSFNAGSISFNFSEDTFDVEDLMKEAAYSLPPEAEGLITEAEFESAANVVVGMVAATVAAVAGIALLYSLLLGSWVRVGLVNMLDRLLDGEKPRAGMLFREGAYKRSVKLALLRALFVTLWSMLLLIPGIIANYRYAMSEYLLNANPGMGALEAIKESGRRMRGRKWRLFCLELSFIGWYFLTALAWVVPMVAGMFMILSGNPLAVLGGMILAFAGLLACAVASLFLNTYVNTSIVAFLRDAQRSASWHEEARAGAEYAEAMQELAEGSREYAEAEREVGEESFTPAGESQSIQGRGVHPQPMGSVLSADETVAKDMFLQHKCSRELLAQAGLLEEYLQLQPSPISEMRWMRDYGDILMRRFDQDSDALDDLLNLSAEYAMDDLLSRALQRIERHIRQETLPDAEILDMCGRTLALLVSGRFGDNPGFVQRKKEQVSDMADRLEHRLSESDSDGAWNDALALIRRMCE